MKIHKEAFPTALYVILPALTVGIVAFFYLPFAFFIPIGIICFVLILLVLNFFRNPTVPIAYNERWILSPCDGKVVAIEEVFEPLFFQENRIQVSIFMSPLNVHVNRSPISGEVVHYQYYPGKFLVAFHPKSSKENEQTFLVIQNDRLRIGLKQIAGAVARRIRCYVKKGETLTQGQEFGFIKFGSRVDILLPTHCQLKIRLHQPTVGGQTVLAEIP